jgi:hypothetical protein
MLFEIKKFFRRKTKHTFILKSGKEIVFYADSVNKIVDGNDLVGYEIRGGNGSMFYCRLDEVAAIVVG